MTERIDHAAEAADDLQYADEVIASGADDVVRAVAAIAQVHATLALVEQQRIANLIAYAAHRNDHQSAIGNHYPDSLRDLLSEADFAIREGLGL